MINLVARSFSKKSVIKVTPKAVERIKHLLAKKEPTQAVKIGVRRRGCNGMSYTMEYSEKPNRLDEVVEVDGARIIIDSKAVMFLIGTEMDYINTPTREEFVFENPNAKGSCGCGESFNV